MQQAAFGGTPFSADVDLWLELEEHPKKTVPLTQAGVDFVAFAEPVALPAGPAWVILSVDGELYRNRVYLVNGSTKGSLEAAIACYKDGAPF